jgi:hypothetical protein
MAKSKSSNPAEIARKELLKSFRKDLAKLKKFGLAGLKTNPRKQTPTKWFKAQIKKYSDVLEGKAKVVKINKKQKAKFKEANYRTTRNKAVVPAAQNETVRVTKEGYNIVRHNKGGKIKTERMLMSQAELVNFLESIRNKPKYRNLPQDKYLSFRYYGNNSTMIFQGSKKGEAIDLLMNRFEQYDSVIGAQQTGKAEDAQDVIRNFEIVTLKRDELIFWSDERVEARTMRKNNRNTERYNKWQRENYKHRNEFQKKAKRESNIQYRESVKQNPAEYERQKAAARIRAQKSRQNAKAKKK